LRTDAEQHFAEPRGLLRLWAGFLVPTLAWILHHQTSYYLVYWACERDIVFIFHAVSVFWLLAAGAGIFVAWRAWHDAGADWADEGDRVVDRSRFFALGSILWGAFLLVVIISQWIPAFVVDPCLR
jgi:hypothetical protein